ncbi:hypothetical protein CRENBAI_025980 [Crenichthys baileyi]|uniref:Uncharacterized protein n=1 Tax=Crenichthys baileyi TaxID=28760 RepID=A0AAV9SMN0_9TELE
MNSRELHPKSRNKAPPFRYLICIFTHGSHSRGQTQTAAIHHLQMNNHQDDQVPDSACTSGPIQWEEHPSGLIGTPLPSDSVSTPRGQERRTWLSEVRSG